MAREQCKEPINMNKLYLISFASFIWTVTGTAQQITRRAEITGNAVDGKCTIEVIVDGAAEVEVQGDVGRIRNLSGQPAVWRRFVCNGRMPSNPHDFRFRGIDGRGDVRLLQDPRQSGGRIVFRIDDPQGGREGYTVDLEWRGSNGGQWNNQDNRGWRDPDYRGDSRDLDQRNQGNREVDRRNQSNRDLDQRNQADRRDSRYYDNRGRWNPEGAARAIQVCQDAVVERIESDGYRNVTFRNVIPDDNPGRFDFVNGFATAKLAWFRSVGFQFSCSVNLANGNVRSLDVTRR